jgi:hypothetical protein
MIREDLTLFEEAKNVSVLALWQQSQRHTPISTETAGGILAYILTS